MRRTATILVLLIATALSISCSGAKGKEAKEELPQTLEQEVALRPLPDGAVAFDYAGHLYFDVVLRDSIPARMIFDTGNTISCSIRSFSRSTSLHRQPCSEL